MQDKKDTSSWYEVIFSVYKELKLRKQNKKNHPLDLYLEEQTDILLQLFKECLFLGFAYDDDDAESLISRVFKEVQKSTNEELRVRLNEELILVNNPFFSLYIGFCYMELTLELIKKEYENNLNVTLDTLEQRIYNSDDFQNLSEVSRNIGRRVINGELHPNFKILKNHISEQLEYIERSKKQPLIESTPPKTLSIETTSATVEDKKLVLSQREIALIYWYDRDNLSFSKSTAQQIAEDNGHKSKSSGQSLYKDHYLPVRDKYGERTDNATSIQYLNNIIPRLTTDRGKREANEDLKKAYEFKEKKRNNLF
jgi:hypothetical protein